jgi:hypothetical protein
LVVRRALLRARRAVAARLRGELAAEIDEIGAALGRR